MKRLDGTDGNTRSQPTGILTAGTSTDAPGSLPGSRLIVGGGGGGGPAASGIHLGLQRRQLAANQEPDCDIYRTLHASPLQHGAEVW